MHEPCFKPSLEQTSCGGFTKARGETAELTAVQLSHEWSTRLKEPLKEPPDETFVLAPSIVSPRGNVHTTTLRFFRGHTNNASITRAAHHISITVTRHGFQSFQSFQRKATRSHRVLDDRSFRQRELFLFQ